MNPMKDKKRIGAWYLGEGRCAFTVWAPNVEQLSLKLLEKAERLLTMDCGEDGYWHTVAEEVAPGTRYVYILGEAGEERPDPAAFHQPEGVHGPSAVVDHGAFSWSDSDWKGVSLQEMVVYELHVGTFTPEGTFEAIIPRLAELRDLGITAVEIMPVAQFPGTRGWGYDGVHPFAPQNSYGGPDGLKRLVDACHREGLSITLDVVYNHLGPEGNYLRDFGPYFTPKYRTPWGEAVNMDDAGSDEVRHYFIENALFWFREYHVDALRLDATDRIYDFSATRFLEHLAREVDAYERESGRRCLLVAENDLNDARLLRPPAAGGFGIDAHWSDDFHHALHALLTKEDAGYYTDYGQAADLAKSFRDNYIYDWRYSRYRDHSRGNSAADLPKHQFVVCSQNHDQVGNRMFGHRLITLASFEAAKTAAAAVLLSPFVPLLFMGEEYGEEAPFQFFADFQDADLREAVHKGRQEEFTAFKWRGDPPDPHDPATFERSRLNWELREEGRHGTMLAWYRRLLEVRQEISAPPQPDSSGVEADAFEEQKVVWVRRHGADSEVLLLFNFREEASEISFPVSEGKWYKSLDSADLCWEGPGAGPAQSSASGETLSLPPQSFTLFIRE